MDLDRVLDDPCVDAIALATPVATHYELVRRCLDAGKNVYVEKPLAASTEHARELIDLATDRGLVLMTGHTFLYSPPVEAIRKLIAEGELGDVFFVSASRVNLGIHQRDVSVVWDLGPHDFSILLSWFDSAPTAIRAIGRDSILPGIADVAFVTLEFESGLIANIELSWLAPCKLRRTVIVGSQKMVVYEDGSAEPVRIFDSGVIYKDPESFGEFHLSYRTGDILSPRVSNDEPLALHLADFVHAVEQGIPCYENMDISHDVVKLAEAAETSIRRGGARVDLSTSVAPVVALRGRETIDATATRRHYGA